jgi:probable HAF family extracellular repeat protein
VLWKDGHIINLGKLGGNQSQAFALNNRDQVVGVAANAVADPFSMLSWGTQARAFLWQDGVARDLGTLGGPDSFAWFIDDRGQVAGVSYTSAIPNPTTGQPPTHLFLWNGTMRDLGSLGGSLQTFGGVNALNERGEIAGASHLAGDQTTHPFLWNGRSLIDLGTFGGTFGTANWLNDAGEVVGAATTTGDQVLHAFRWKDGAMTDLGTLSGDTCSVAVNDNARGQIVGQSFRCDGPTRAVLWDRGSIVDLNTLVAPSNLRLTEALNINNRGEIVGNARLRDGSVHEYLLIPNHPDNSSTGH